jgi:hypothetical protein
MSIIFLVASIAKDIPSEFVTIQKVSEASFDERIYMRSTSVLMQASVMKHAEKDFLIIYLTVENETKINPMT